jgi:hypothetical protein
MELELKILKEKVVEDEKKSGIGSLFDDEKTSFEHISLLKIKYQKMQKDFLELTEELNDTIRRVNEEQLILNSRIDIMMTQNKNILEEKAEFDQKFRREKHKFEQEGKNMRAQRMELEGDLRNMENHSFKEGEENYSMKMSIDKDREFDELETYRHNLDCKLYNAEIEAKKKTIEELEKKISDIAKYFEQYKEYQDAKAEGEKLESEIEEALISFEFKKI